MTSFDDILAGKRADGKEDPVVGFVGHPRPKIVCPDGFEMSVQAGEWLYCEPRSHDGPWSTVECGFPSARPEPWTDWSEYVEDAQAPTETVYGYVPIEMVEALLRLHGWTPAVITA